MNAERIRHFLLTLPHVQETQQWGGVVFWVGDKAIGGKMFAMMNPDPGTGPPMSFATDAEHFSELCEVDGLIPAPYFARIHWIAAERWDAFRIPAWEEHLRAAQQLTYGKLPPKVKSLLALPEAELGRLVIERRKTLAAKAASAKTVPSKKKAAR